MDCCLSLPDDVLKRKTNSFFPTIISYWNHIIFGDLILLSRLASNEIGPLNIADFNKFPIPKSPQDIYFHQLSDLKNLREALDELIERFCINLTEDDCENVITYTTTEGELINRVVADVIQHIFNHQTHHRGQLTCVLSQFGVEYGCMDLPVIVSEGSRT